jgi:hypothetical protein
LQALFAITLFVSATLLFLIQPMIAKMILPSLGGTPNVWNTCMVFFQALLLAGYLYAHLTTQRLGVRKQAVLHVGVLLLPLLTLTLLTFPLRIAKGGTAVSEGGLLGWLGTPPTEHNPIPWLLALLLVCVGLPFFVVSTSAPLLQKWFASTGDPAARDPYFLYAASNLGSMLALVGYPALLEPQLRLANQGLLWAAGYGVFLLLTVCCAVALWRSPPAKVGDGTGPARRAKGASHDWGPDQEKVSAGRRLRWVACAFVPSSLLLGVTTYLSTDIAAVPLLWVIPLALYLLTFILVFARFTIVPHKVIVVVMPVLILLQEYWIITERTRPIEFLIPLNLLTFFVTAMLCHGELARDRPSTQYLTEFYLWMSVGGVLGGMFNALLAPLIFSTVTEYRVVMVLACFLLPWSKPRQVNEAWPWLPYALDFSLPTALGLLTVILIVFAPQLEKVRENIPKGFMECLKYGLPAALCYLLVDRPMRFGLGVGAVFLAAAYGSHYLDRDRLVHGERSFFGVLRVTDNSDGSYRSLVHGSTLHGRQKMDLPEGERHTAIEYYHPAGPIGQVFAAFPGPTPIKQIAVLGLGTGGMAYYVQPGREITFFEIDPAVPPIAWTYFSYLSECPVQPRIVMGDARLRLAGDERVYDIILADAFSSDAIPIHLLTLEAIRDVYLPRLAPDGILIFHISNRYLDLEPVLSAVAAEAGLVGRYQGDGKDDDIDKAASSVVILARSEAALGPLAQDPRWVALPEAEAKNLWTDDFSNILGVFNFSVKNELNNLWDRVRRR